MNFLEDYSIFFWLILVILIVLLSNAAIRSWSNSHRLARLPGTYAPLVRSWLPFGIDVAIKSVKEMWNDRFHEYLSGQLKSKPGKTIEFHVLDKRMIVTDNPDNIREVMSTQFTIYGKGELTHRIFKNCFEGSIFGADGADWVAHRALLKPYIAIIRPSDAQKLENHLQRMLAEKITGDNSPIEVYDMLDIMLLESMTDIFVNPMADPHYEYSQPRSFVNGVNALLKMNSFRVLLGNISLLVPDKLIAWKSIRALHGYLDTHVRCIHRLQETAYKEKPKRSWTLMETFASEGVSDKAYRSQFVALLSASKDPVCITVVWIIYELGRQPEIVQRLRAEILETLGEDIHSLPSDTQLRGMKYLQSIIKEGLRLYHPFGYNIRCPNKDTVLPTGGGPNGDQPIPILRGTCILLNVLGLHRRTDIVGPDAEVFRPERWGTFKPGPWEYMPFLRGPRNCLGQAFAHFTMGYLLVRLYQLYDIVPADNIKQQIRVEMNTKMSSPLNMRFYRRQ